MGIAALSDWLTQMLPGKQANPNPIFQPHPVKKQQPTIQPGIPLPTFSTRSDGGYDVQNLPAGTSTFAPYGPGLGVLKNPQRGLPHFDPTGQYSDQNLPNNPDAFLLMPMAQPQFKQMPYLQKVGY